ncbi:MAG: histidinol-phosphate transaminase [Deltaproteobacteria bacterium]|nr:histidinol-phosphate transaminase [Deltaproteobacteria bacterium]
MKPLVSENVASLVPYVPGKPIEEVERELGIKGSIKLASNENPFGPSPKAVSAIRKSLSQIHRYPEGDCFYLRERLAQHLGVAPEELVFGNGSNEILELFVRTFLTPGDEALLSESTFLVYGLLLQAAGIGIRRIPLKAHCYDFKAMAQAVGPKTRALFIANPNNPTGTFVRREEFKQFLKQVPPEIFIVMDEAYFEFATDPDYPDSLVYRKDRPLLITLRTFSKAYGLASLRIGYGVCSQEVASFMNRVRQPFNVNGLAQIAAVAALGDSEHVSKTVRNNQKGILFLSRELQKMKVESIPSQANFLLVKVGGSAERVYQDLLREGVIVRPMGVYDLPEFIRVTVGLPAENKRFIQALKKIYGKT